MNLTLIRRVRRVVARTGIALVVLLVAFSAFTHLVPVTGRQLFIIGGGSMEPAVPVGSLVITSPVDPIDIATGDVVTVSSQDGLPITHRVSRVVDGSVGRSFELKGDANPSPDAALVSAGAVIGTADWFIPYAGYVQSYLSTSTGATSVLVLLVAFVAAYMLLEILERLAQEAPAPRRDLAGR